MKVILNRLTHTMKAQKAQKAQKALFVINETVWYISWNESGLKCAQFM